MTSRRQWQNEIKDGGNRAKLTAADLLMAEKAAYAAYEAKLRQMSYSDRRVARLARNSEKMVISLCLSMLARGWGDLFNSTVQEYVNKASKEPARYAPLSYSLQQSLRVIAAQTAPPAYRHATAPGSRLDSR